MNNLENTNYNLLTETSKIIMNDERKKYTDLDVEITHFPTPNPNALKFVFNVMLAYKGKSTYREMSDCVNNELARDLLQLPFVENAHFFQNTLTITKRSNFEWDQILDTIKRFLEEEVPYHNPDFEELDEEEQRRKNLPPELLEIETILDRTIRPGLQADGGDLTCVDFKDDVLLIKYMGACGSCPSSSTGTLSAIKHILSDELKKPIEVYILPE